MDSVNEDAKPTSGTGLQFPPVPEGISQPVHDTTSPSPLAITKSPPLTWHILSKSKSPNVHFRHGV